MAYWDIDTINDQLIFTWDDPAVNLFGTDAGETLTAGLGHDTIHAVGGDGFVNGGFGHDRINGGTGADRFFHLGIFDHGSDWIQDYSTVEADLLT